MNSRNPKPKYKRCKNCNTNTDSPAWVGAKLVCQKCARYYATFKELPSKEYIKKQKEYGLWKK